MLGNFKLFSAFGITVFIHWSWFVVAYFMMRYSALGETYEERAAVYLSLFGIVTLHEFGHALACRSVKGRAERIVLFPLGGVAFVSPPQRPWPVLWSIVAGPLVNVALVPVTIGAFFLAGGTITATETGGLLVQDDGFLRSYLFTIANINLVLLVFNMLPIYPLDGGQTLHAILWFFMGRAKSLKIAATIGLVFGIGLGVLFLFTGELFGLLLAAFIVWQAINGLRMARAIALASMQVEPWQMGR